jgi:segregation and condensation protein B
VGEKDAIEQHGATGMVVEDRQTGGVAKPAESGEADTELPEVDAAMTDRAAIGDGSVISLEPIADEVSPHSGEAAALSNPAAREEAVVSGAASDVDAAGDNPASAGAANEAAADQVSGKHAIIDSDVLPNPDTGASLRHDVAADAEVPGQALTDGSVEAAVSAEDGSPAETGAADDDDARTRPAPAGDAALEDAVARSAGSDAVMSEDPAAAHSVDVSNGLEECAAEDDAAGPFEPPARASAELKAILEALIFASPEPLSLKALTKLLDSEPKEDVATALAGLKEDYERPGGLQLVEVAGGYQIVTRHDLHEWVRRLFHERSTQKLSAQALETLAVIAYRQPITAVEITEIRGVNTSGVLNTLLERHLIKIVGRKAVVGRPFMYSSTKEFLIRFGLNDLTDLPRVEDMVDALGLEAPLLVEQAPLEDQLPLEEPDTESDSVLSSADDDELGEPDEPEDPETRGGPGSVH